MRVWILVLLASLVAVSGCLGGDDDPDDGDGGDDGDNGQNGDNGDNGTVGPEETEFSFGPSAGCEGSLSGEGACVSFQGGPAASGVDGFWVELGEPYWGLGFTTTIDSVLGDSDCYFVADDQATILGNGHNGADPCGGTIPDNTAYLFLYSYVEPQSGMTLTFEV